MKIANRKDAVLLIVLFVMIVVVGYKSVVMDPIQTNSAEEEHVVVLMEEVIEKNHTGALYRYGVIQTRVVAVKSEMGGGFKGRYRKYLFGIFPMGDVFFSSDQAKNEMRRTNE